MTQTSGDHEELSLAIRGAIAGASTEDVAVLDILRRQYSDPKQLSGLLDTCASLVLWETCLVPGDLWTPHRKVWSRERALHTRTDLLTNQDGKFLIASENPWNHAWIQEMVNQVHCWPKIVLVDRSQSLQWLEAETATTERTEIGATTEPVVQFVDDAIRRGFKLGASDIHFECDRLGITVRTRIDGAMTPLFRMEGVKAAHQAISRIKVLAALDITEKRVPQDGRMRQNVDGIPVDLRVSVMPSVHGEDAVLRLLDKSRWRGKSEASLNLLGFDDSSIDKIRTLAAQPSGMLLVTGPTGSGKTTTVYAALTEVNHGREKIVTIEDPVEYELPGVLQIPVNDRKGLTFAKGLRSILRHDPDRILVGEIRDAETAEIAVQSALTGHQVLTTVHANSIGDVVGRFRHFGIDMFGFMSALNGMVVQRLLRRLCSDCLTFMAPNDDDKGWLQDHGLELSKVPVSNGCGICRQSGYRGRFVVSEIHIVDDALRDLVTTNAPISQLRTHTASTAGLTLAQQAARSVLLGQTSVAEVRRVVGITV